MNQSLSRFKRSAATLIIPPTTLAFKQTCNWSIITAVDPKVGCPTSHNPYRTVRARETKQSGAGWDVGSSRVRSGARGLIPGVRRRRRRRPRVSGQPLSGSGGARGSGRPNLTGPGPRRRSRPRTELHWLTGQLGPARPYPKGRGPLVFSRQPWRIHRMSQFQNVSRSRWLLVPARRPGLAGPDGMDA